MYVTPEHSYDFQKLAEVTKVIVRNLNKIIDINYYPVPEASAVLSWCGARGARGSGDKGPLVPYGLGQKGSVRGIW